MIAGRESAVALAGSLPEQAGWVGLATLIAAVGVLSWWLLGSPLSGPVAPVDPTERILRVRRLMAAVVLLSGVLLRIGAPWDELWHRLYGVPFGEDLLWPPHLLMYASFALSFFLVAYGLSVALGGRGGVRERFRREPLLAALGLLSAYGFAFIPLDIVWHAVIGPDLMAESPPHVAGALSGAAVSLVGVALALSSPARPTWGRLFDRPRLPAVIVLGILVVLALNWLQLLVTGWEFGDPSVLGRPGWMYPITVLVIGAVVSHLALHTTRRVGAASAVALTVLAAHAPVVLLFRLLIPPGPVFAAHLLLVPAAVTLDLWYARRAGREDETVTQWTGAVLYGAVLLIVGLPYISSMTTVLVLDPTTVTAAAAAGLIATLGAGLLAVRIGRYLSDAGHVPAREPAGQSMLPGSRRSAVESGSR